MGWTGFRKVGGVGFHGGRVSNPPLHYGVAVTVGVRGNDGMVPHRVRRVTLGSTGGRVSNPPLHYGVVVTVGVRGNDGMVPHRVPRAALGSTGGRVSNPPLHYGVVVTVGVRGNDGMVPHRVRRVTLGSTGGVGFDGGRWVPRGAGFKPAPTLWGRGGRRCRLSTSWNLTA